MLKKLLKTIIFTGIFFLTLTSNTQAATNLVTNPGAETGDATGWSNVVNAGDGWDFNFADIYHSGSYSFQSSYVWNSMDQTIDLLDTYTQDQLNKKPTITFSSWITQRNDHHGYYYMIYQIRDSSNNVIASKTYGSLADPVELDADTAWFENEHTFSNYNTAPRYVYIKFAGFDGGEWGGAYGPYFDDFSITVDESAFQTSSRSFSKDTRCHANKPPKLTWLKLTPMNKEGVRGMEITWTQIGATSLDIHIDNGTGKYPWKMSKVKNTGRKFLPNVTVNQKVKIQAHNKCSVGDFSKGLSNKEFPNGWYNL